MTAVTETGNETLQARFGATSSPQPKGWLGRARPAAR